MSLQSTADRLSLLTPEEVGALLRVPTGTLAVWRCTGRVKLAYIKIGRAVRYRQGDVEAFVAAHEHGHDEV